jgi:hypothetical protein
MAILDIFVTVYAFCLFNGLLLEALELWADSPVPGADSVLDASQPRLLEAGV